MHRFDTWFKLFYQENLNGIGVA